MRKRARTLRFIASAIDAHLDNAPHDSVKLWLNSMDGMKALDDLDAVAADLRLKEGSAIVRRTTWARSGDKAKRRFTQHTMGYQAGLINPDDVE